MSIAFDPKKPLCLFGSEAEAVAVPVERCGKWLSERIDLDTLGEVMRIGEPRALQEGSFCASRHTGDDGGSSGGSGSGSGGTHQQAQACSRGPQRSTRTQFFPLDKRDTSIHSSILLDSGIEIRAYSLVTGCEETSESLIGRAVSIVASSIPYNPAVDLVAADLAVTPAVLQAIDRAWADERCSLSLRHYRPLLGLSQY